MASIRTYALIYVVLLALGTSKFIFFHFDFDYTLAIGGTILLAVVKSGLIMGYYQHLIDEPRSITYTMAVAFFMVFLLTLAAGFSIQ